MSDKKKELEGELKAKIFGQDRAVEAAQHVPAKRLLDRIRHV